MQALIKACPGPCYHVTIRVGGDPFRSLAGDWSEALGAVLLAPSLILLREHHVR